MSERIETGAVEPIVAVVVDQLGQPLLARTNIKAKVWRISDGEYLDWSDMTFRPGPAVARLLEPLLEVNQAYSPGEYRLDLDTSTIVNPTPDDSYQVMVLQDAPNGAANLPQVGELRVGQWVDRAAGGPYTVLQSYSYDLAAEVLTGMVWVEHRDLVVSAPTSVSVTWYLPDGTALFTMTDLVPDAQGFFKVSRPAVVLSLNVSYYAIAQVTLPGVGVVSGGKGIFTVG